jgi:shikimate kinase
MARNIVLAGFMGTGKSTAGRIVAGRLGMTFVDSDVEIEALAGRRIADIFSQSGEGAFRQIEAEVCQRLAAGTNQVIATGGGALLNPATRVASEQSGVVICLRCELGEIIRRVGDDPERPLFGSRDAVKRLLAARADAYASLPHQIATTHLSPEQVAEEIIALWKSNG